MNEQYRDYMYGKKYVALGDSFTEGAFSKFVDENGLAMTESPVIFDKEWNMYKTYPYWIGRRNGMNVINLAKCGGTITYMPEIGPNGNERSLSTIYKQVPLDADYITICIGINDSYKKALIGDTKSDDSTTFCGAWNTVLRYLITNLPYAKIGIIITNACGSQAYPDAIRRMARRWGIPYLDLEEDCGVPVMNCVRGRSEMCDEARQLRSKAFTIPGENFHPNIQAHKYLSTVVEHFMKSL
ncbi:MAG: SGNH/GDSL hydrolase family protein [Clostridia bacterium]|nr:SGNH/GDSL hydrolase family protein [Clostridia bacterium]